MDGAAKFVRGDAIAGLLITAINLVGGFVIGMHPAGHDAPARRWRPTPRLSVGDGLVTQIPALIVSTAAGIIVTYGAKSPRVGDAIATQLTRHPERAVDGGGDHPAAGPGARLPAAAVPALAIIAGGMAYMVRGRDRHGRPTARPRCQTQPEPRRREPPPIRDLLAVEPLEVEVGLRPGAAGGRGPAGRPAAADRPHAEAAGRRAGHHRARRPGSATTSSCRPPSTPSSCAASGWPAAK